MASPIRPTSPHLTIYRPQITTVLSILHRITGVALYAGSALLLTFLFVAAYTPLHFETMHEMLAWPISQGILMAFTFAFFFHFYNGIRHLFWDMGKGFEVKFAAKTGWAALLCALISTFATWMLAQQNVGVF